MEEVNDVNLLIEREQFWLDEKQAYNHKIGFNICKVAHSTLDKPPSQKCIEVISKEYYLTDPTGNEILVKNLAKFCRDNGLSRNTLKNVTRGVDVRHKGWKCRPADMSLEEWNSMRDARLIASKHYKRWKVVSPEGKELVIINLKKFCRENGLTSTRMQNVARGNNSHHKGWKCEYA